MEKYLVKTELYGKREFVLLDEHEICDIEVFIRKGNKKNNHHSSYPSDLIYILALAQFKLNPQRQADVYLVHGDAKIAVDQFPIFMRQYKNSCCLCIKLKLATYEGVDDYHLVSIYIICIYMYSRGEQLRMLYETTALSAVYIYTYILYSNMRQ